MSHVDFDLTDHVVTLTLNRPDKLNAVTPEMTTEIRKLVDRINTDRDIRAVVLTGTGKAFCAGSDIAELDTYSTPWEFRDRPDYCDGIRGIKKPVIAAINGYAFGGGLELSMSCDIRLAADTAKFASPEIKLGWIGGGGMAAFLTHSIGPSNAAIMLYTGDPVDAQQALQWGLVSKLYPIDELHPAANELAGTIAARAPIAAQTGKLNLRAAHSKTLEDCIQYERDLQTVSFGTQDAVEGREAFKQKRDPKFTGR